MKLVVVDRSPTTYEYVPTGAGIRNRLPRVIAPARVQEFDQAGRRGEFFIVEDEDVAGVADDLARQNPGCNVQTFELVAEVICPPAELVRKQITKDGILPS